MSEQSLSRKKILGFLFISKKPNFIKKNLLKGPSYHMTIVFSFIEQHRTVKVSFIILRGLRVFVH